MVCGAYRRRNVRAGVPNPGRCVGLGGVEPSHRDGDPQPERERAAIRLRERSASGTPEAR